MLIMAVLLLTLLSLSTTILSLAENINIDCGASESDLRSNDITSWVGDEGFITTGNSSRIPGEKNKPFRSLRFFPSASGQANCYGNIPVTRGRKTLVRTVFYYGNYDEKSSPPSFSVIYDYKYIDNITFTDSSPSDEYQSLFISEVIFSPARNNISICLFRTSQSDPFISAIQVYSMDAGMYDDVGANEGLLLRQRFAYGAKVAIRDPYGRIWSPIRPNNPGSSELTTSPSSIDTTGVPNKPPATVMSKALLEDVIRLSDKTLPLAGSRLYLALYFSEPQSLGGTKKRSFNVFLDTKQLSSSPIVPVFGNATQFVIKDIVATSASQLFFQSTKDSALPPIVNAMELYSILDAPVGGGSGGGHSGGKGGEGQSDGGDNSDDREGRREKNAKADKAAKVMPKIPDGGPRKPKLPLIFGVTIGSTLAALSSVFAAIFCKRSQNAKPQSNTEPAMSTVSGEEAGVAPLVGLQLASDHHQHRAA